MATSTLPAPARASATEPLPLRFRPETLARRQVATCLQCGSPRRHELVQDSGYHLQRCDDCALAYVSDPPTASELQRYYSFASGYHTEFATSRAVREEYLQRGRTYLPYLTRHVRTGRLLDVGCSAGFFLKVARDFGWNVTGLELSTDTAELGRRMYGLPITTGDLTSHPFAAGSFDAITLWDVIEHLPDPLAAMRTAFDLLAPAGHVAFSTPNIDGLYPRLSYLPGKLLKRWPHVEPPGHLFQFSARTLRAMLERAGFEFVWQTTRRIPLSYSFGDLWPMLRMPKRLAYAAVFAPLAAVAPWIGMGDEVVMVARKPRT